jgi:hypothetical protein
VMWGLTGCLGVMESYGLFGGDVCLYIDALSDGLWTYPCPQPGVCT